MNVGIMTAYQEPVGFNYGILQFCSELGRSDYGVKPVLIAMTRHSRDSALIDEARRCGIQVETVCEEFRYDPRVVRELTTLVDRLDLGLLDAQTYKPLACALAARALRPHLCLVSWVHGFTSENLKVRAFGAAERFLHRFSDKVICVCQPFAQRIAAGGVGEDKLEIIPNAIDDAEVAAGERERMREELGIGKGAPVVGAVGRLSPEKGHTFLIRAWREISASEPAARLIIVGDGPCASALRQEVASLDLTGSVTFTGFRPDGRRLAGLFDVAVLPSLAEGLPYALLESMVQRVPVVASAVGDVPNVLENGRLGRLVTPGDSSALAQSVLGLLREPQEAKRLAFAAREAVLDRYSQPARARSIVTAYREAVNGRFRSRM